ncbi:MAG: hypothetical protein COA42_14300 [Alteromonadaceae bacterium]|nr:MAG: hypothetical protein COA42_14300 [Alteromonadaceae bacterium]
MDYRDLHLPQENIDKPLLGQLSGIKPKPIFIVGLHRSGTTILYKLISEMIGIPALDVYHILYYERLLNDFKCDESGSNRKKLDDFFFANGMATRVMDNISLSSTTVEEYGWLLKKHAGDMKLTHRTANFFSELCAKLQLINNPAGPVLFKNPWDTRNVKEISQLYPDAKFIYIKRNPLAILNSQYSNAIHYGKEIDPFLDLLIKDIWSGKAIIGSQRLMYRLTGEKRYKKIMLSLLKKDVAVEMGYYQFGYDEISADRKIQISYEDFVDSPKYIIKKIAEFLELNIVGDLESVEMTPRKQTNKPEVEAVSAKLSNLIAKLASNR